MNGNSVHASPTKQPKMPQVKEEQEEETKVNHSIPNGHHGPMPVANGDPPMNGTNGEAATIIKASEDNHVGEHVPLVAAAE